ncbi:hypothetical protein [Endothiovibrio diazotrophicus]
MAVKKKRRTRITAKQRNCIIAACSTLEIDEDTRHDLVMQFSGRRTSSLNSKTGLFSDEATKLITYLSRNGAPVPKKPYRTKRGAQSQPSGAVTVMASPAQRKTIDRLKEQVTWREEGGFELWHEKNLKIKRIRTKEEAERVIEGLKGVTRHGK